MGSAVSNGTTSVGTKTHETNMDLATWTWAGWVKRTGLGEGDFRLMNKASGSNAGPLQVTGQSGGGALRGRQTRASAASVAISLGDVMPSDTWACLFVIFNGADTQGIRLYAYNGTSAVAEMSYSSITNGSGAATFNTEALRVFNTTDGSLTYQGKAAHWVVTPDIWDNTTMLAFAQGTIPVGLTDHYWPFQSDGSDAGEVGGWPLTLTNVTFDGADSPPVTYGATVVTPAVIPTVAAFPAATTDTPGNVTVTPATLATTTTFPPATQSISVAATPATIAATTAFAAWAVDVSAGPDTIPVVAAFPAASTSVPSSPTVTPATITATAAFPLVSLDGDAVVSPATVATSVTYPAATVHADATVTPATITVTAAFPQASPSGGGVVVEAAIYTGDVTGPARFVEAYTGPATARDVDGPDLARTVTGPGAQT